MGLWIDFYFVLILSIPRLLLSSDEELVFDLTGDAVYHYNKGSQYDKGIGVRENKTLALHHLLLAAEGNHSEALNYLGFFYDLGIGVDPNVSTAFAYLERSSKLGSARGHYGVGSYYDTGTAVPENKELALKHFQLAADQSIPDAIIMVGVYYEKGFVVSRNATRALEYYLRAAKLGSAVGQFNAGLFYASNDTNHILALQYYTMAANQNYSFAQYEVGYCHENGIGTKTNFSEALKYYLLAADNGHVDAQYQVGFFLRYGYGGVTADKDRADHYFKLASENGHIHSQCTMTHEGIETDLDVFRANKAAIGGSPECRRLLQSLLRDLQNNFCCCASIGGCSQLLSDLVGENMEEYCNSAESVTYGDDTYCCQDYQRELWRLYYRGDSFSMSILGQLLDNDCAPSISIDDERYSFDILSILFTALSQLPLPSLLSLMAMTACIAVLLTRHELMSRPWRIFLLLWSPIALFLSSVYNLVKIAWFNGEVPTVHQLVVVVEEVPREELGANVLPEAANLIQPEDAEMSEASSDHRNGVQ